MRMPRPRDLRSGTDPDPRFTLANERTFLAWIRTALGLLAAAAALEAFGDRVVPGPVHAALVVGLAVLAAVVGATSLVRWMRVEIALRRREPLPVPATTVVLAVGLTVAVVVFLVGLAA